MNLPNKLDAVIIHYESSNFEGLEHKIIGLVVAIAALVMSQKRVNTPN